MSDAEGPEFRYSDLLPIGPDHTPYRLVTTDGVSTFEAGGRTFLEVSSEAIRRLTAEATTTSSICGVGAASQRMAGSAMTGSTSTPTRPA